MEYTLRLLSSNRWVFEVYSDRCLIFTSDSYDTYFEAFLHGLAVWLSAQPPGVFGA